MNSKNILLVNPRFPLIHQDYDYILPIVEKKFIAPPLNLLTLASLISDDHEVRLIDTNVEPLTDECLKWANLVLITGIDAQSESMRGICERCKSGFGRPAVVLGGLHASVYREDFESLADSIVAGEAEDVLPRLLDDHERNDLKKLYNSECSITDITRSPCPRFDLVNMQDYLLATVQYSRGCQFSCDFCQLPHFYGRKPREKDADQFLRELDALRGAGFRGTVMLGDDNFHRCPHAGEMLDRLLDWQNAHDFPFRFFTQTDIRIAEQSDLMRRMVEAGFIALQIGIESPSMDSLRSVHKRQNMGFDLVESVRTIQRSGLEVLPAMLLGLDGDPDDIFDLQFDFLQEAGTPRCMISMLRPLRGSALYDVMKKSGRLLSDEPLGNQTGDFVTNFEPMMGRERFLEGMVNLVRRLFSPENYFSRCRKFFRVHSARKYRKRPFSLRNSGYLLNYARRAHAPEFNRHFLRFALWTLIVCPSRFLHAVELGMLGYHYYRMMKRAEVDSRETAASAD